MTEEKEKKLHSPESGGKPGKKSPEEDIGTLKTMADPSSSPPPVAPKRPKQEDVATIPVKPGAVKKGAVEARPAAAKAGSSLDDIYPVAPKAPLEKKVSEAGGGPASDMATAPTVMPVKAPGVDLLGDRLRKSGVLPALHEPLTNEHPGRYQIKTQIGQGGIGRVMLGVDTHLGREVAIKELLPRHVPGQSQTGVPGQALTASRTPAERRFLDEARITGQLEHPGVVPVYELGQRPDGSIYYTMKRVRGRTMGLAIKGKDLAGRLEVLPNYLEVCHAVAYAHSRGVVHRDLKPENVMMGEFGETVVLDWGLAKIKGQRDRRLQTLSEGIQEMKRRKGTETVAGTAIGTPSFMSPEQASGKLDKVDARSDVYSLGAILYQILTGRPPHGGRAAMEVLEKVQKEDVVPPRKREPDAPPELEAIALRALSRDRGARYADAKELAEDVRRFQAGRMVRAHTYTVWELVGRWFRRNWKPIAVTAGVLLVAASVWFYRGYSEQQARRRAELLRRGRARASVAGIIRDTAKGSQVKNWLDIYTFKLISLKEPLVVDLLIKALGHEKPEVRMLAARSLGGMKSKRAIDPLCARLKEGVEKSESVAIEVINALGIIGDSRADVPVRKARWRYGVYTHVWKSTELAYRMIPLPPLPRTGVTAEMLAERGRSLLHKGDREGALKWFTRAIKLDPRSARTHNNRAIILRQMGKYEEAMRDYNRAIELEPDRWAGYNNRALLRKRMGELEGALDDLNRAVALDKLNCVLLYNRAILHRDMGNPDQALRDFNRILVLQPKKTSVYFSLAITWRDKKKLDRALGYLEKGLKIQPKYLDALVLRASILKLKKDFAGAAADLDRVLAMDPEHETALRWRARTRLARGDKEGGRADLDRVVALNPKLARTWGSRAAIYHYQLKDYKSALTEFEKALELAGKKARIDRYRYRLFVVSTALRMGDRQKIAKMIAQARTVDPPRPENFVFDHFRGKADAATVLARRTDAKWKCRANFYIGLKAELDGRVEEAKRRYRASIDTLRNWLLEYVLARANLKLLESGSGAKP